jgi:hypothetical protein
MGVTASTAIPFTDQELDDYQVTFSIFFYHLINF